MSPATAQIRATTADGKHVLLNADGTWKYLIEEIEKDSALLKNLAANDSARQMAKSDSVKALVVERTPPNLDCNALLAVNRDNDRFFAVLKRLVVSKDNKSGFVISFYKTKHGPLVWTTHIMGPAVCISEDTKLTLVLKNGTVFNFGNEGTNNCTGDFKLNFGGTAGKEDAFDMLRANDILALRVWDKKASTDQYVHAYDAAIFKAAINCLMEMSK